MRYVHKYAENKNVLSERLKESLLMAGSLILSGKIFNKQNTFSSIEYLRNTTRCWASSE